MGKSKMNMDITTGGSAFASKFHIDEPETVGDMKNKSGSLDSLDIYKVTTQKEQYTRLVCTMLRNRGQTFLFNKIKEDIYGHWMRDSSLTKCCDYLMQNGKVKSNEY